MSSNLSVFINFIFLLSAINCWQLPNGILQVQTLVRHGARTQFEDSYPNDPYKNYNFYPYTYGQLTMEGKNNAYTIGEQIRNRYGFFNVSFVENLVNMTADDYSRVQETALCLAAGLWPPMANETFVPKRLPWQPLAYTTQIYRPIDSDKLPSLFENNEFKRAIQPYTAEVNYIMKYSGLNSFDHFDEVYSSLTSQLHLGLTLPEWSKKVYPEPLQTINGIVLSAPALDPASRRNVCGTVRNIVEIFRNTLSNRTAMGAPLNVYAAHDSNIACALQCLNIEIDQYQVQFTGSLTFELYEKPYVGLKFLWQEGVDTRPKYLQVRNCSSLLCPFNEFLELFQKSST